MLFEMTDLQLPSPTPVPEGMGDFHARINEKDAYPYAKYPKWSGSRNRSLITDKNIDEKDSSAVGSVKTAETILSPTGFW